MNAARQPPWQVDPEDIPADVADRLGRLQHPRECGSYDAYRAHPPPCRYEGRHADVDRHRAAVRLSQELTDLGVDIDEFDLIVDRRLWQ